MASQLTQFSSEQQNPDFPGVKDIEPKELWEKKSQVLIVDVRRPDEFTGELGHITGAKMVVLDVLPQQISELPKDQTIVFVCRSGGRSGRAAAFAQEQGFSHVFNLKGGMLLWNQLKLAVDERFGD